MTNHLLACQYVPDGIKGSAETHKRGRKRRADEDEEGPSKASAGAASTKLRLASASSDNITMTRNLPTQHKFNVIAMKAVPFGPSKQEAFSQQLLRACISAGWSFNSLSDPEVVKLFHDYIPGATIPTRQAVSGKILRAEVTRVEAEIQHTFSKGAYSVLSGDGWRDLSKTHQIAFTHTVERQVSSSPVID
jgi:hypothetical protein